jgi:hypothetical protein
MQHKEVELYSINDHDYLDIGLVQLQKPDKINLHCYHNKVRVSLVVWYQNTHHILMHNTFLVNITQ